MSAFVGTDTFVIRLFDGVGDVGADHRVGERDAGAPPPPPPPPGEVEFNFNLAKVPLEDAISAEANVLVIMDDSGSMDWACDDRRRGRRVLADQRRHQRQRTSVLRRPNTSTSSRSRPTSTATRAILPTEQALAARRGVRWQQLRCVARLELPVQHRLLQPAVQYKPWVGLNRNNVDFPNVIADCGAARSVRRGAFRRSI